VPNAEVLLRPYVESTSLEEAESALDRVAGEETAPPRVLGDCYDELASDAADEKQLDAAVRLERKAIASGCSNRSLAREMLAWYLLEAGDVREGEELFAELRRERPGDADLLIGLGHARSAAGLREAALEAFDEAVAVAKLRGHRKVVDRARIERRAEREHVGLPADEDDRLAPAARPLGHAPTAWALAWFPPDQRGAALECWPTLAVDFADPAGYAQRLEGHLRSLRRATGERPRVAAIDVEELIAWSAAEGYDPDSGEARSQFAAELARTGRALAWPPERNELCWCGSGLKYKRCCGR
jgi:tetratricopeptide (TPR) repeat protein